MSRREQLMQAIRQGRALEVGRGGKEVRTQGESTGQGAPIKAHTWGAR